VYGQVSLSVLAARVLHNTTPRTFSPVSSTTFDALPSVHHRNSCIPARGNEAYLEHQSG
jgi:hypothetical protein